MTTRQEYIDNARDAVQQARLWRDDAAVSRELWRDSPFGSNAEAMHHAHMCDARQMMAACASLAVAEAVLAELASDEAPTLSPELSARIEQAIEDPSSRIKGRGRPQRHEESE